MWLQLKQLSNEGIPVKTQKSIDIMISIGKHRASFVLLYPGILILAALVSAQVTTVTVHENTVTNSVTPYMTGSCMEDVNHEVYGGIYSQMLFGESFQEPSSSPIAGFESYGGNWTVSGGIASVAGTSGPKLIANSTTSSDCEAGVEVNLGTNAGPCGLVIRVSQPGTGADNFYGYEIGLAPNLARIGKHENNYTLLSDIACAVPTGQWVALKVTIAGSTITVYVNNTNVGSYTDASGPIASGSIGLRAWLDGTTQFRNLWVNTGTGVRNLPFATSTAQISGMWRGVATGSAVGSCSMDTQTPFKGTQSQKITFASGAGHIGIENRGLNRQGLYFSANKPYEGYLWARSTQSTPVSIALESADGATVLAETTITVSSAAWTRSNFSLTPGAAANPGRFSITLRQAGSVSIGHAFLEPGEWGRFHGLPVRKDVGDALVAQKNTILRFGGCMAQWAGYRWKNQIGPPDQRPAVDGWWYNWSSMGWGIVDFLNYCEKAGILGIPDFNYRDSGQSMADFVDYVNGPATTTYGAKRVADGHPAPYNIKYIEFGNEEHLNDGYFYPAFESTAKAIWAKDTSIIIVVGDFGYHNVITDPYNFTGGDGCNSLATHKKILDLAKQYNRQVWFDVHIWTETLPQPTDIPAVVSFYNQLGAISPGANYKLVCFEFNANSHNLQRALCNAHGINELERIDNMFMMNSSANCLQVDGQNDNGWDQGLLFMNPEKVWAQPPYYVTQMAANCYLPLCVNAVLPTAITSALDVTATKSQDGRTVALKVVNLTGTLVRARFAFDSFEPTGKIATVTTLAGALADANTAALTTRIVPLTAIRYATASDTFAFAGYSYTTIKLSEPVGAGRKVELSRGGSYKILKTSRGIQIVWNGSCDRALPVVSIHTLKGATIAKVKTESAGKGNAHVFTWSGKLDNGSRAPGGSYIVSLTDAQGRIACFPVVYVGR